MFQKNFLKLPFPSNSCQRVTVQIPFEKKDWVFHMDHDFGHLCFGQLLVLNILQALLLCPDFCGYHLKCWWSLFSEHCIRTRIIFYNDISLCTFDIDAPAPNSWDDRDPSMTQHELFCPYALLHRSLLSCFWPLPPAMPLFSQVFLILSPQLPLRLEFSMLEAPEWICEQDCNES